MQPILPPGWEWVLPSKALNRAVGTSFDFGDAEVTAKHVWGEWENQSGLKRTDLGALTFKALRAANVERCNSGVFNHNLMEWTPERYATALAGEVGEACNIIKKLFRGFETDNVNVEMVGDELADAQAYLDLLAARFDLDLEECIIRKFNRVSEKVGSDVRL